MKVSYNWLNEKYFNGQLPTAATLAEALTFHAWEIEEVSEIGDDTVLDVKVLPDKSMWAFSHRGIAKDLSVILNLPLTTDPLKNKTILDTKADSIGISIESDICRRFAAAKIEGVKVGPSPEWLRKALETIGQRSINNIVDASNYVMFDLGQPSHAFDAKQVGEKGFLIRSAQDGEKLIGLDEKEYTFTSADTLITRGDTGEVLSIAGLKGGLHSGIGENTTNIIVEVANWDPVAIRKTGQRLRLRTDASARYENGVVPEMIPFGLAALIDTIIAVAGGEVVSIEEKINAATKHHTVSGSLVKINSVLGTALTISDVTTIIDRFGWNKELNGEEFIITPPFERTDLKITEDLIEEIGRIHGYQHVKAIIPQPVPLSEINQRFYYSEIIRDCLINKGFSEIFTSSFRSKDEVKIANALASDKGYLRSSLTENMRESLAKNAPNADLLGVTQIRLFEIGTVFSNTEQKMMLNLGVQSPSGYKAKKDDPVLQEAILALNQVLGIAITAKTEAGVAEINLDKLLVSLPQAIKYQKANLLKETSYKTFSSYPAISRDIALWVSDDVAAIEVESGLNQAAGDLRVRTTLFDQFEKDGRISLAFRLVFQSSERTLTDTEVNTIMDNIYTVAKGHNWEVR